MVLLQLPAARSAVTSFHCLTVKAALLTISYLRALIRHVQCSVQPGPKESAFCTESSFCSKSVDIYQHVAVDCDYI